MSTQQFAETPQDLGREDNTGHVELSIRDWGDYHDVYEWLLPTTNRKQNPLEVMETVAEYLADVPPTQETLTKKNLGVDTNGQSVVHRIFRLFRITEFDTETRPYRYRVPDYQYYEQRTVPVEQDDYADWWERWRHIPTIDANFVAHHWGVGKNAVCMWVGRNYDTPVQEQWRQNRRRFARTLHTIRVWTGRDVKEITELLGLNPSGPRSAISEFIHNSDWKPPHRPRELQWHHADRFNHESD